MKTAPLKNSLLLFITVAAMHLPATASACSACMGDPSSKTAGAMNGAIFLLLGFITLMLGCVGAFMVMLVRRANAPLTSHADLAQMVNASGDAQ